ncbi:hypothetical protein G6F35_011446 [Rhizopus arrhizus]|nr:hypothetical protein G6F35_011446 [Rhizopus arrhizus]
MGDIQSPFQAAAPPRQGEAQAEVQRRDDHVGRKRLKRRVVDHLADVRHLGHPDDGRDRRVLDDLHHEPDRGWGGDAQGLRQYHQPQALGARQRQAIGRLPLGTRHGLQAAAPDLAQIGGGKQGDADGRGHDGRHFKAHDRQAEVQDEHHDQQRRALNQLDVAAGQPGHGRAA